MIWSGSWIHFEGEGLVNWADIKAGSFVEGGMLAGVLNAPSAYSADTHKDLARQRTGQVLDKMVKYRIITHEQADAIKALTIEQMFDNIVLWQLRMCVLQGDELHGLQKTYHRAA